MKIGVLGCQGAIHEHIHHLQNLGAETVVIQRPDQLRSVQAMVFPGGESTTMRYLIDLHHLWTALQEWYDEKKPILATCAGLVLLSRLSKDSIPSTSSQHPSSIPPLGWLNVQVHRNAFGRQVDSFETSCSLENIAKDFPAVFIRAPIIESVGEGVKVLARVRGKIIAVQQKKILATSFHPELTQDSRLHQWLIHQI